jgi:hypothetical protein
MSSGGGGGAFWDMDHVVGVVSLTPKWAWLQRRAGYAKRERWLSEFHFYFLCLDFIDIYWLYILCIILCCFHINSQELFKVAEIHTTASKAAPHEVLAPPLKYPLACSAQFHTPQNLFFSP